MQILQSHSSKFLTFYEVEDKKQLRILTTRQYNVNFLYDKTLVAQKPLFPGMIK